MRSLGKKIHTNCSACIKPQEIISRPGKHGLVDEELKVATLFAGCGGDSLGFKNAGFEISYANDNNPNACASLEAVFGKDIVHWGNVRDEYNFGKANVITGGFPCQGFSLAGPRLVGDERNSLYLELKRTISIVNPEFFVAENVKGFVTLGENGNGTHFENGRIKNLGKVAKAIVESFASVGKGYNVSIELHNAKDFGLPQDRERIIIVGVRKDLDYKFLFPKPTHGTGADLMPYVTLRDAIGNMPEPVDGETYDGYFSSRYMSRNRIRGWDQVSFTIPAEAGQVPLHPDSKPMLPVKHGIFWDVEKIVEAKCSKSHCNEMITRYESHIPKILEAVCENFHGPVTYQVRDKRTFIGKRPRRLSWKECARIQGFPDGYPFRGRLEEIYRQIGNAVPPPLMQKIAENIRPYFDGKKISDLQKSIEKLEVFA